jgi:hypothetical protein
MTVHLALLIATHVRHAMAQHLVVSKIVRRELSTATHVRHASSKIVRPEASTAIHVRLVTTVHHALSIVTHAQRATRVTVAHHVVSKTVRLALSTETHSQRAIHAMVTHARQELSTAQNLAAHASSTTDHASLIATTATTAPTVVQTALTVLTAIAIVTAPSKARARATQIRRPSLKTRSLSVSRA